MNDLDKIRDEIIELSNFDSYTPFQQHCNKILQMIDDYAASCKQPIIGLQMSMPQKCLDCPCLHTIIIDDIKARFCMAAHRDIIVLHEDDYDVWFNFQKPQWCPWIDIGASND